MKILIVTGAFNSKGGGVEEHIVSLVKALAEQGYDITVFSCHWNSVANQYIIRLRSFGIAFKQIDFITTLWIKNKEYIRLQIINIIVLLIFPIIFMVSLYNAIQLRRSLCRSIKGAMGRVKGIFSSHFPPAYIRIEERKETEKILGNYFTSWQPDVIHIHRTDCISFLESKLLTSYPIIYTEHGTPRSESIETSKYISRADLLIAVSRESEVCIRKYWLYNRPIVVIPSIIDDYQERDFSAKSKDEARVTIGYIGRIDKNKNVGMLLEAFEILTKRGYEINLLIAGDGPELSVLKNSYRHLNEKIKFKGWYKHPQLSAIMEIIDIIVLPSFSEGLPVSLIESMAFGKAIIASNVGGIPSLINNGENGILFNAFEIKELTDKLENLVRDSSLRKLLGLNARNTFLASPFSSDEVVKRIMLSYNQVIENKRHATFNDK